MDKELCSFVVTKKVNCVHQLSEESSDILLCHIQRKIKALLLRNGPATQGTSLSHKKSAREKQKLYVACGLTCTINFTMQRNQSSRPWGSGLVRKQIQQLSIGVALPEEGCYILYIL